MKVGDTVFVIKRHSNSGKLRETTVTKVGKKYFEVWETGLWEKFLINPKNVNERDSIRRDGGLGAYTWWEDKETYENNKGIEVKRQFIKDNIHLMNDKLINSLYDLIKK